MSRPNQTVWGKVLRITSPSSTGLRCRFILSPEGHPWGAEANVGGLDYSVFVPYAAGMRTYTGNYIIEPGKAVARFDLNGLEGFRIDGTEIHEARWNPDDGRWYMSLPHTGMPTVSCTIYWANPLTGAKMGLLCGPVGYWQAHHWEPGIGIMLRPEDDPGDLNTFSFWCIGGEEGWTYGGQYRWHFENLHNQYLRHSRTLFRTIHEGDAPALTAKFEKFSIGQTSLSRSVETVEPWENWMWDNGRGLPNSRPYATCYARSPVFDMSEKSWRAITYGTPAPQHFHECIGGVIWPSGSPPYPDGMTGWKLQRYSYTLRPPYEYQYWDPDTWTYKWATFTYNEYVRNVIDEVNLLDLLPEGPSTGWVGLNTGRTGDAWGISEDYWMFKANAQNYYLCVRRADLAVFTIDWDQDYAASHPNNMPPDSCRFYGGTPLLCASGNPHLLIDMKTGNVTVPRQGAWLWNGDLPPTMRDGLLGYDAWWFYEEPGYDLPATWHGDTVVASVPIAIHVADGQAEEVPGCPPGQHKAKATFTVQEIRSQNPVNSATVQVAIKAKCDGEVIFSETQSNTTGSDGKAAFTLSSCVGCVGDLEIHFTITNVTSPDDRPYEPGANLCDEVIWRPDGP